MKYLFFIIDKYYKSVCAKGGYILSLIIILCVPGLIYYHGEYMTHSALSVTVKMGFVLLIGSGLACLISTISPSLPPSLHGNQKHVIVRKCLFWGIWIFCAVLSLIELFLLVNFATRISPQMLLLLLETDVSEASQFVTAYCWKPSAILMVFGYLLIAFLPVIFNRHISRFRLWKYVKLPVLSLLFGGYILIGLDIYVWGVGQAAWPTWPFYGNRFIPLDGLIFSWGMQSFSEDLPILVEATKKLQSEKGQVVYTSPNIVVIIGESFSKYHSSLYEYPIKTNPLLEQRKAAGNLFVFSDVVTPWNATNYALKGIFSLKSEDEQSDDDWNNAPIFPTVFKYFGYHVMLLSNQNIKETGVDHEFRTAYYLDDDYIHSTSFDCRNTERYQYDKQLIDAYKGFVRGFGCNLAIFHLKGQHTLAKNTFPSDWTYFTIDSVGRIDLPISHRQYIADYDNATRYNDYVVDEIIKLYENKDAIVIYFSDHGEEVYDYRNHIGRSHEPQLFPNAVKYQYEIPFLIWVSNTYKQNHPDVVDRIGISVDRPYMSSEVYQLLFDLAGIEGRWMDRTRSVINPEFRPRKRILRGGDGVYEEVMGK